MLYYNAQTNGFYDDSISPAPLGSIAVADEQHKTLMQAQSEGKIIQAGIDGSPIAVTPAGPQNNTIEVLHQLSVIDSKKIRAITDFILTGDKTRLEQLEEHLIL